MTCFPQEFYKTCCSFDMSMYVDDCCLLIVVLLFAIDVRLNGEQTFVVEKSCEQRQHSKASGTPHKLPIFICITQCILICMCCYAKPVQNPLFLCLGSHNILSRNIDAMQLMKGFYKMLSDYSGLCSWLSSPRMNFYTTQGCEHGDFYLRVHVH